MKRKIIYSLLIWGGLGLAPSTAAGEDPGRYPSRPLTYIVQFGPGGGADMLGRKLSEVAGGLLGQPILVENKAGGAGVIGINALAKSKPDGYTVGGFSYSATVIAPHIRKVPFDTRKDFSFICGFAEYTHALAIRAERPWKTFKEFMEDARKNPGKYTYGSPGPKSEQYIFLKQIFNREKVKLRHVPFEGAAEQTTAVLGGHIDVGILSSAGVPHLQAGKLRALAVDTKERWKICPDVPTFEELGHKIEKPKWIGVAAPAAVPERILTRLREAFSKAAQDPSFLELIRKLQMVPLHRSAAEFRDVVLRHYEIQGKFLQEVELD